MSLFLKQFPARSTPKTYADTINQTETLQSKNISRTYVIGSTVSSIQLPRARHDGMVEFPIYAVHKRASSQDTLPHTVVRLVARKCENISKINAKSQPERTFSSVPPLTHSHTFPSMCRSPDVVCAGYASRGATPTPHSVSRRLLQEF